jgi:hypothetical protein
VLRAEGIGDRGILDEPVRIPHGTLGVPEHAPYQAIVVAAAAPRVHGAPAPEGRGGR